MDVLTTTIEEGAIIILVVAVAVAMIAVILAVLYGVPTLVANASVEI